MANALRAVEKNLRKKGTQADIQSMSMISMDDRKPAHGTPHVNAVLQTAASYRAISSTATYEMDTRPWFELSRHKHESG